MGLNQRLYGPELQVCMCHCPHLWFCACKTAPDLHQNYKSVLVPVLTCRFVHSKQRLYDQNYKSAMGPRPLPVVLCKQNSVLTTRITSLYGSQTSSMDLCVSKTVCLAPELQVCMGPRPHLWICACKTAWLATRITSLYGSQASSVVF